MGIFGRLADTVEKVTGATPPAPPKHSRVARYWERVTHGTFTTGDGTVYTFRDGQLRRVRMWAKGHVGKNQKKRYRRLTRQGHARKLAAASQVLGREISQLVS